MADVITVEDYVDAKCVRHWHVMSNAEIHAQLPEGAQVKTSIEAGVHDLRASWSYCGPLNIFAAGRNRRLLVWSLREGERVSEAIRAAGEMFERATKFAPKYAWVRTLPTGAENCMDVHEMVLLEAEWMLENAVAVGGRRT